MLLKLGFIRRTREKAVDKLLPVNMDEKYPDTTKKVRRKKYDTLAVGIAGAASNLLPGVPFQAAAAKALAPKEEASRAAVSATTGSLLGTATGATYLSGAVIKDKGGIKPAVQGVKNILKPKSNPSKARDIKIPVIGKKIVSGKKLEKTTKLPVEKVQRVLKGIGKYKSKLKGAAILTALGSGVGSALGYEKALRKKKEQENV